MARATLVLACWLVAVAPVRAAVWEYTINASPGASVLHVTARLSGMGTTELSVNDGAEPFLQNLEVEVGSHWVKVAPRGTSWFVPAAALRGCQLRYDYHLESAAQHIQDSDNASEHQGVLQAQAGCFVLRPVQGDEADVRLRVTTSAPTQFVTGIQSVGSNAWEIDAGDLWSGPDCAFGPLSVSHLSIGQADLEIAWLPHAFDLGDAEVANWLHSKLNAVVQYFGRLPLKQGLILLLPSGHHGVHGHASGGSGFSVMVMVGTSVTAEELKEDWTFTHEMVHVCTPSVPRPQHWMEEGIATYLEPIIRVRAGDLTVQRVWTDMVEGLPKGQPDTGDQGLNRTPTWGRTYWGGCMFWFLADLRIREQTHNQKSLRDVLRGLMEQGANIANTWRPERVLEVGDAATGTHVLNDLYAELADKPTTVDLSALWQKLGIRLDGDHLVTFPAPQADLRDALTTP